MVNQGVGAVPRLAFFQAAEIMRLDRCSYVILRRTGRRVFCNQDPHHQGVHRGEYGDRPIRIVPPCSSCNGKGFQTLADYRRENRGKK